MAAIAGDRDPPFWGEFLRPNGYGILWINYVVAGAVGADVAAIAALAAVAADVADFLQHSRLTMITSRCAIHAAVLHGQARLRSPRGFRLMRLPEPPRRRPVHLGGPHRWRPAWSLEPLERLGAAGNPSSRPLPHLLRLGIRRWEARHASLPHLLRLGIHPGGLAAISFLWAAD